MKKRLISIIILSLILASTPISTASAEVTTAITAAQATIINNINSGESYDSISIKNIPMGGGTLRYYSSNSDTVPFKVRPFDTDETTVTQILDASSLNPAGGTIYVTLQLTNQEESARTAITYLAEKTAPPAASKLVSITAYDSRFNLSQVTLNYTGLPVGTILRIYENDNTGNGKLLSVVTLDSSYYTGVADSKKNVVLYLRGCGSVAQAGELNIQITQQFPNRSESVGLDAKIFTPDYTTRPILSFHESLINVISFVGEAGNYIEFINDNSNPNNPANWLGTYNIYRKITDTTPALTVTLDSKNASITGHKINLGPTSALKLGNTGGTLYFASVVNGKEATWRTPITYGTITEQDSVMLPKAAAPLESNFIIANNKDNMDTITYKGTKGDIVYLYYSSDSNTRYIPLVVNTTKSINGVTAQVGTVKIAQLGLTAGSLYATVQNSTGVESNRVEIHYPAESSVSGSGGGNESTTSPNTTLPATATPTSGSFVVVNNVRNDDTITYTGTAGDVVNVYTTSSGGSAIATGTIASDSTRVIIYISQLGSKSGKVYLTVTKAGKRESARLSKSYSAEVKTATPSSKNIAVKNNKSGISDTITVTKLAAGDIVNVYATSTATEAIGTGTVADDEISITISVDEIGVAKGTLYVTVTSTNKLESSKVAKAYITDVSNPPSSKKITVTNNFVGTPDTVKVTGLIADDVVTIYDAAIDGTALGSATVETGATVATVSIDQLSVAAGNIYATVTSANKAESIRIPKTYKTEAAIKAPISTSITVTNNYSGTADIVTLIGLTPGDIVKVYSVSKGGSPIGTATVDTDKTDASVDIAQIGVPAGKLYITLTGANGLESKRTKKTYLAEITDPITSDKVTVSNYAKGTYDIVKVTGLRADDVVKVYNAETRGTVLKSGKVPTGSTEITLSISQLSASTGSIYVTVTSKNARESTRTKIDYLAEVKSDTLNTATNSIVVTNNKGISDTIVVDALETGDIIVVYRDSTSKTVLGKVTVAANSTSATIKLKQLGYLSGKVCISVIKKGQLESDRLEVEYSSES